MERISPDLAADPSLEGVMSAFSGMVRRVGWRHRLSEADIDELVQDVRIRLWRSQSRKGSETIEPMPASYIYRTACTAALDIIRRRRAGRAALHDDIHDNATLGGLADVSVKAGHTPVDDMESSELAAQVEQAIEDIPSSRRAVVRMYLAGYPREEIAELMGWSEAKTRNLLYRGLGDLREQLIAMGIGVDRVKGRGDGRVD